MKILEYRPSKETAYFIHTVFFNFYCLLIARAATVAMGICPATDAQSIWCLRLRWVKRLTDVIFLSMGGQYFDSFVAGKPLDWIEFTVSFFFPFLALITIHRGIFMDTDLKPARHWADHILKVCRAIFFSLGSLLLVAMLIRMGFELRDQFNDSRLILIEKPRIGAVPPK
jgi:hypothetical protein